MATLVSILATQGYLRVARGLVALEAGEGSTLRVLTSTVELNPRRVLRLPVHTTGCWEQNAWALLREVADSRASRLDKTRVKSRAKGFWLLRLSPVTPPL